MAKVIDEGKSYQILIDPLLKHSHQKVAHLIKEGSTVIDIACGTGALARQISTRARSITGIDLSASMIKQAKSLKLANAECLVMDAKNLSQFPDQKFDYATISMAIHQFPRDLAKQILMEMKRIAKSIIILDYTDKMPKDPAGFFVIFIEWLAGREHNGNFRQYLKQGGLDTILEECGLVTENKIVSVNKIFNIIKCRTKI
ncbi:MAG: class I SAM-dependent methyltransferase [Candidatus Marinimicrobia bacterium]|nr:class I SAM-dependent methyltransferase [Candidatus Neomarinimicrobiota bacterium]